MKPGPPRVGGGAATCLHRLDRLARGGQLGVPAEAREDRRAGVRAGEVRGGEGARHHLDEVVARVPPLSRRGRGVEGLRDVGRDDQAVPVIEFRDVGARDVRAHQPRAQVRVRVARDAPLPVHRNRLVEVDVLVNHLHLAPQHPHAK